VILAAVIASFVLGLGDQNNPAPTASFEMQYDDNSGSPELTIIHEDGDELDPAVVYIRGDSIGNTNTGGNAYGAGDTWEDISGSSSNIKAGNSITLGDGGTDTSSDYEVRVIWEDPDSDQTSTLNTDEGPNA
jgi:FlaG/FlaF family flagellin (archaellin)